MEFLIGAIILYLLYKLITWKPMSRTSKNSSFPAKITALKPSVQNKVVHGPKNSLSTWHDGDDEFATFTIHTNFRRKTEESLNKEYGQWIDEGDQRIILGRKINKGLFYFGGIMDSLDGYEIEPSLVDETRPASNVSVNLGSELYIDETLGYWPSYASLSKECRGAYLDWLASDRSNSETPIGYVFIYFYGMERRVVENKANLSMSEQEFTIIFEEVLRLHKVFSANRSFGMYSANLLELMAFLRPTIFEHRAAEMPRTYNGWSFKLKLAQTITRGQTVGAELAFEWLKNTLEYSLKTPARRCEEEFHQLFDIKFAREFQEGLSVKPNKTKLKLSYQAASNGITGFDLDLEDLPDPSILKAPISKLIPIAEQCTEELASYSRYLGKVDASKNDIAAVMLLPRALATGANSPIIKTFKSWAIQVVQSDGGLTTVRQFWSHTGLPLPKAMNKKENELLYQLAEKVNIGIAPDIRFHQEKFKVDDNIVLFEPGHGDFFEPSSAFNQVSLAIRLGAMVATIDDVIDQNEQQALQQIIEHDARLSSIEKKSLTAYLAWRLTSAVSTVGLKNRVEQLKPSQIESLKSFMITIALADGKVSSSEIKQIEKLYTCLGLNKSLVVNDIHNLAAVSVPKPSSLIDTNDSADSFGLDENVLAMHERETIDAKAILEDIFMSEEDADIAPKSDLPRDVGLDRAHQDLFNRLLNREKWPRNEVHELCCNLNLMIDGAIETINDWAYEKVDAPVLEDNGEIYVDLDIYEELKG